MASGSSSRGIVLLFLTSGFFITGLIFDYMPMIIDDHIKRTIELATNDEILSLWSKPPIDVHSYYWLYDIMNAEQFQNAGERVQVRKVGPFQFASRPEKRIIELSANKYRIVYNSTRITRLNESFAGNERLDERLTLLNPIYASIAEGARVHAAAMDPQQGAMIMGSVNRLTERFNESLFMNTTAREALIGRPMPIVAKMRKMAETFGLESQVPDLVPGGKFGYVALTNSTWSGPFEVYTGYQETAKSLGDVISYKGKRRLSYYEGKCNRLQASAGELRPLPIDGAQLLEMFSPNFCRIVHLRPTGLHKLREGLAYSYVLAAEDFASADQNPDNRCFCLNSTTSAATTTNQDSSSSSNNNNYCSLNGAIELAPCSFGAPLIVTVSNIAPDSKMLSSIQNYDPDLLRSELDHLATNDLVQIMILRRFGVPVFADLTATLFAKVTRDSRFKHTTNVPEVSYIPLVMIRETATIPPRFGQIMVNLESFLALTYHIKVIMYLSSLVLLCWLTGYYYRSTSHSDRVVPESQIRRSSSGLSGSGGGGGGGNGGASGNLSGGGERNGSMGATRNGGRGGGGQAAAAGTTLGRDGQAATTTTVGESFRIKRGLERNQSIVDKQQQQAGDTASSERANSADSSRSQPPSRRTSRLNSLETSAGGNLSQDEGQQQQQEAAAAESQLAARPEAGDQAGQSLGDADDVDDKQQRGDNRQQDNNVVARIFSKVDEELAGRRLGKQQQKQQQMVAAAAAANGLNQNFSGGGESSSKARLRREAADNEDGAGEATPGEPREQQEGQSDEQDGHQATKRRSPKNWFMNVYSGFVRMLHGIRTTISDVGQLDISENDYQDKQLEMLAGKIDNWYTTQPSPSPEIGAAADDEGPQQPQPAPPTATSKPGEGGGGEATTTATVELGSGSVDSARPVTRIVRSPPAKEVGKGGAAPEVAAENIKATTTATNGTPKPDGGDKQQSQSMMAKKRDSASKVAVVDGQELAGSSSSNANKPAAAAASVTKVAGPSSSGNAGLAPKPKQQQEKETKTGDAIGGGGDLKESADQMLKNNSETNEEAEAEEEDKQKLLEEEEDDEDTIEQESGKQQQSGEQQQHGKSLQMSGKVVQDSVERDNDGAPDDDHQQSLKSPSDLNNDSKMDSSPSSNPTTIDKKSTKLGSTVQSSPASPPASRATAASTLSRSDTSDRSDELATIEDWPELEDASCKASALEQIEAVLVGTEQESSSPPPLSRQQRQLAASNNTRAAQSNGLEQLDELGESMCGENHDDDHDGSEPKPSGKFTKSNGRPMMINSSTSIDSVINLAAEAETEPDARRTTRRTTPPTTTNDIASALDSAGGSSGGGNFVADQSANKPASSTKSNGNGGPYQIDESSSRVGSAMKLQQQQQQQQHSTPPPTSRWSPPRNTRTGSNSGSRLPTPSGDSKLAQQKKDDNNPLETTTTTKTIPNEPLAANRTSRAATLEQQQQQANNNNTMIGSNKFDERLPLDETHQRLASGGGQRNAFDDDVDDNGGQLFTALSHQQQQQRRGGGKEDDQSAANKKGGADKRDNERHEEDDIKLDSRNGIIEINNNNNKSNNIYELQSIGTPPLLSNGQVGGSSLKLPLSPLSFNAATRTTRSPPFNATTQTRQQQQQIGLGNGRAPTPTKLQVGNVGEQIQLQRQQIKGKLTSETNSNSNGYNSVTISNQSPIQLINANGGGGGAKLLPRTNGNLAGIATFNGNNNGNNNMLNGKIMFQQQQQQQQRLQDSLGRSGTVIV